MSTPPILRDALSDLLSDSLDQGYREAAVRKIDHPVQGSARRSTALTAAGALLIGLVLITAYLHASAGAPSDARARADLRSRITAAQRDDGTLSRGVRTLQSQVDQSGALVLGSPSKSGLGPAQVESGLAAVRGPGIVVTLGNPPAIPSAAATGRAGRTPLSQVSVLTDVDVRAVVNELWHLGAQAVAVNGVRLTPISAIRFAGLTVLVDFQPVTAPYTVSAIGDPDALITAFTDSGVADRYRTLASADGFAFSIDQDSSIIVPASVLTDLRYAHVPSATAQSHPTATATPTPPVPTSPTRIPTTRTPASTSTGSAGPSRPTPQSGAPS